MRSIAQKFFWIPLLCIACSSVPAEYTKRYCNESGGYNQGMNDARSVLPANESFANRCDDETMALARKGYHEGYNAGLNSMRGEQTKTQLNPMIGTEDQTNPRAYYCLLRAFDTNFSSFGPTETEARHRVHAACADKYAEIHCLSEKIACQPNQ